MSNVVRFPVERRRAPELVTIKDLCEQFGMSERWFRYRLKEGMPTHRWGGRLRFSPEEVKCWLDERYQQAGAKEG